ncbi:MAG TPA: hypothetical protein VFW45_16805 [Candidatus Polarisedimenticolia bacterium]|nr:hypothetical protein [Candidatus Polarisedimenticolia bacterium]
MKYFRFRVSLLAAVVVLLAVLLPPGAGASDAVKWKTRGRGGGGNMFSVAVSPTNPDIVLMGSDVGGIFRSTDGGLTWKMRNNALTDPNRHAAYGVQGFVWDPNGTTVYMDTMKSMDAGDTWTEKVTPHLPNSWLSGAIDPANHDIVYLVKPPTIYRSACGLESTCAIESSEIPGATCTPDCGDTAATCCFDNGARVQLVFDPGNSSHMIACTRWGLFESTYNGSWNGSNWTSVTTDLPYDDCNDMVVHPASAVTYMTLGTRRTKDGTGWSRIETWNGGVYKSNPSCPAGWGHCWTAINGTDAGTNLLPNPGFETAGIPPLPDQWSSPNSNVSRECGGVGRNSACALKIVSGGPGGGAGAPVYSPLLPIEGGKIYRASGWAKASYTSCEQPFDGRANYFDAQQQLLYWPLDPTQARSLLWNDTNLSYDSNVNGGWRYFETRIRPLDGAAYVIFEVDANCSAGSVGTTWIDDVELVQEGFSETPPVGRLPRVGGSAPETTWVNYRNIVVDPTSAGTIYVSTGPNFVGGPSSSYPNPLLADSGGVWKTTDGGTSWDLTTRSAYRDNVLDGILSAPSCGDNVCSGRGEDCVTCPTDCSSSPCCGNRRPNPPALNVCESGETKYTCPVDCPEYEDATRPYYERTLNGYDIWDLAIGSGSGHETLYFGNPNGKYVTRDGGAQWTELTSDLMESPVPPEPPIGAWKTRGDTNDILALSVLTWPTEANMPERLFYGDRDNRLMSSFDQGESFAAAVANKAAGNNAWALLSQPVKGQSPTDMLVDPSDWDTIYVAASGGEFGGGSDTVGIIRGDFHPNQTGGDPWTWAPLGDLDTLGDGGGINFVQDDTGAFFAAVLNDGVYKLASAASTAWEHLTSGWTPAPPLYWKTARIAFEPSDKKLFVSGGLPARGLDAPVPTAAETGVWESRTVPPGNLGDTWKKISPSAMEGENVSWLLPDGPNTLFVTTSYPDANPPTPLVHGGIHKAKWIWDGSIWRWDWTKVLTTMSMDGIVISQKDSSILYALAPQAAPFNQQNMQHQDPGTWKSIDGGETWTLLANNGLSHFFPGMKLFFSQNNFQRLYATTQGGGLFEGTISCTDPVRDFECAVRNDVGTQGTPISGVLTFGSVSDLKAGSLDDTYEVFTESGVTNKKKLSLIWTFTGATPGVTYKLRIEGKKTDGGMQTSDNFIFTVGVSTTGTCTGSESGSTFTLSSTTDNDTPVERLAGVLASGTQAFCVKVVDSAQSNDNQSDVLSIDRLYLIPLKASVATAEGLPSGGLGTIFLGSYLDTQGPDETPVQRETLKEGAAGTSSSLNRFYNFGSFPAGTYKLHFKGSRPDNTDGDNFKFRWGTSQNGTQTDITGAVISSANEVAGGTDSGTFTLNSASTLYIFVRDTNSQANKGNLDTVTIDHLAVLTVSPTN